MNYKNLEIPFPIFNVEGLDKDQLKNYAKWFAKVFPKRVGVLTAEVKSTPSYEKWDPDFSKASLYQLGSWFKEIIKKFSLTPKSLEEIQNSLQNWFFNFVIPDVHGITANKAFNSFQNWWLEKLESSQDSKLAGELAMVWFYENLGPKDPDNHSQDYLAFEQKWIEMVRTRLTDPTFYSICADVGIYLSKVFAIHCQESYPHIKWHPSFGSLKYCHYYPHSYVVERRQLFVDFNPITAVTETGLGLFERDSNTMDLQQLYDFWIDCIEIYNKQLPILEELAAVGVKVKSIWEFRYEENECRRQLFSQARSILCNHLKIQRDPYILDALTWVLMEKELLNEQVAHIALEILEKENTTLPPLAQSLLGYLVNLGDPSLEDKALKYFKPSMPGT